MLEIFIYPVSAVMKLWHVFLHSTLGINDSLSWVLSIFGLIIVVRGLITPFQWLILHSGRMSVMLRPKLRALNDEYADVIEYKKLEEKEKREKDLKREYNYRVSAGCIPPLIQIPVFLGLYQVLLRMARPKNGLETTVHEPIGLLTSDDVSQFLHARFGNVPVSAYIAMSPEQFGRLGTTYEEVVVFVFPLLVASALVTFINMMISVVRNYFTVDHDSAIAVAITRMLVVFAIIVPFILVKIGVDGPVPAAIAAYWVANNLWTLIQNVAIYLVLFKKYPFDDELRSFQKERRAERMERSREKRKFIWQRRLALIGFVIAPWWIPAHRTRLAEANQHFAAKKAEKRETKLANKEKRNQRNASRKQHWREERLEKERQKKAQQEESADQAET
ncbi:membrane protein insertase, YidC/Oxa1 family, C-terminal domain [Corynebacterium mustelae]|uniref:Membrane protein insertase YidC n=1 Tax=Corynebacterium mustelae TaxID=571915 RepID=A0A0G3H603_9CORY|nr:membrane protein insertase YidC [Corynebacterium mustelae]AKK07263.1 membrane protein insertase, YidC/Oxa1 family, C-terminal domain [Corynebacterium mustelae]